MAKIIFSNLFGTRKIVLSEKETKKLIRKEEKEEDEFMNDLKGQFTSNMIYLVLSAITVIVALHFLSKLISG